MIEKISDQEELSISEAARSLIAYGIERWLAEHGLSPDY
jgi:beta-lactam-binding protein with PASTA domain